MSSRRDISIIAGDAYSHVVTFDTSQLGFTFTAALDQATPTTFTVTVDSDSQITLSLTTNQTTSLVADNSTIYKWNLRRSDGFTVMGGRAVATDSVAVGSPIVERTYVRTDKPISRTISVRFPD